MAGARGSAPGQSKAATPCWKVLTNDAFDGKVDGLYPAKTYGEAVSHLPTDVQSYSTIAEVIGRARQAALQQAGKGVKADPARCGFALGAKDGTNGVTGGGGGDSKGPIPGVIDKVGSDNADSFPIALIVIAAIAGLLVLGGGAGYLVRRRQRSQAELAAASSTAQSDDDRPTTPPALGP